jgi:signal transduction histidine kinase
MPNPSLLVVDDSKAELEIMALTLEAAVPDAMVSLAEGPLKARAMCEEQSFDCVLVDYNMPQMDGLTLTRELRAADPYLPIILMTSVGNEMLAAEALRSGVSDYIPKSRVTTEAIRRTIDRCRHACAQARLIDEQRSELENFAYALAHDFKQPIRQITTFAQLVSMEIGDSQRGDVQQHLKFLSDAAGRLGKLVDVMSQYTLLHQSPELAETDLSEVVDSVRTLLASYLAERGGAFIAPAQTTVIHANETLMTQVLQNLVFNGLLYNRSPTPRVELKVRRSDDDDWLLSVSDNGLGIEASRLDEIFNPLVRLHNASEYAGSGLGLTLARKAVLAQGGDIWCESVVGEGSTFHIRLPHGPADGANRRRKARRRTQVKPFDSQINA